MYTRTRFALLLEVLIRKGKLTNHMVNNCLTNAQVHRLCRLQPLIEHDHITVEQATTKLSSNEVDKLHQYSELILAKKLTADQAINLSIAAISQQLRKKPRLSFSSFSTLGALQTTSTSPSVTTQQKRPV